MKLALTWKLGFILLLPVVVSAGLLAAFQWTSRSLVGGPAFNNLAGRERMLLEVLLQSVREVHAGKEDERPALRENTLLYGRMLEVIEHGGALSGEPFPAPSALLAGEVGPLRQEWEEIRPLLGQVAEMPASDSVSMKACEEIESRVPRMTRMWDGVRGDLTRRIASAQDEKLVVIATGAVANLLVFLLGLWLVRRHVIRPIARLGGGTGAANESRNEIDRVEDVLWDQRLRLSKTFAELTVRNSALGAAEERARGRADLVESISRAMSEFLSEGSWAQASAILVEEALRQTGSEYGFLGILVNRTTLRVYAHAGVEWDAIRGREFYEKALQQYLEHGYLDFTNLDTLFGHALRTGEAVISNEVATDPRATCRPDGHPPLVTFLGVPMKRGGETVGLIAVANRKAGYAEAERKDIEILANAGGILYESHERREHEGALSEQLRQTQKMEAVGRLAGGVAHDFNNLLTAMIGHTEMVARGLGEGHPEARRVAEIRRCADRAADLTHQLLAFGRKQLLQPKVLLLDQVVRGMSALLSRLISEQIVHVSTHAPDLGRVKADQGQVEQVIMNLAVNARDAMPEGGTLAIDTANADAAEVRFRTGHDAPPGRYVRLTVRDTGCGMSEEVRSRVFEPFFTTKEQGKGTGLGLATVFGIVRQSGGFIGLESELGSGTSFYVYFPCTEEAPEPERPSEAARPVQRGRETVLVAEDEEMVRAVICEFLRAAGYAILESRDVQEALRIAGEHGGPIHLLLTDVVMPGMRGPELAQRISQVRPEARVLFVSGYAADANNGESVLPPDAPYLQKPFSQDDLRRKVREVLDRASSVPTAPRGAGG